MFNIGDIVTVVSDTEFGLQTKGLWIGYKGEITHVSPDSPYPYQLDNLLIGPFKAEELERVNA